MPVPMWLDIWPLRYQSSLPTGMVSQEILTTNVAELCRRARIPVRVTPSRKVIVHPGYHQLCTPHIDVVGIGGSGAKVRSRLGALRALEALAHSHHNPLARHSVCGRGLFSQTEALPAARGSAPSPRHQSHRVASRG